MNRGPLLPGMEEPTKPDAKTLRPRLASELIWHGSTGDVLLFWESMGLERSAIERDMMTFNASIADDMFIIPFVTLDEFMNDPGVRAGIATIYNAKQGGRVASYAEAATTLMLIPRKPQKRSLVDAHRNHLARQANVASQPQKPR